MRKFAPVAEVAWTLCLVTLGCSGTDNSTGPSIGGSASTEIGGSESTGGLNSAGGVLGTGGSSQGIGVGGTVAAGGSPSGGRPSTGGVAPTGGTMSNGATGGVLGTGGSRAAGTGGVAPTGGSGAVGGSAPTGGSNAGGSPATGGSKTNGGAAATGGSKATGGAATTGGTPSTGGSKATGGTPSTGGTTTAGGTASFRCDNLAFAAGATGKSKPAGAVGGMKVLDWAGFTGAISFTFDDSNPSQTTDYSQLKATGAHMTFYMITGSGNAGNAVWKTALADGNEIGNHTQSHQSAASLSDLQTAENYIKTTYGETAYTMAAPNGDASWASVAPNFLFINRGVANNLVSPRDNTNPFTTPAYIPPTGATSATMDAQVTSATGKWRIFCIHGFDSQNGTYQPVPIGNVTATMSNAVASGLWAESMVNVAAYWLGQKAISASATTSATWSLPANFPPNMCVRITTTGGTVMQKGAQVPWDTHGYYQISLDAGSVTIQ